MESPAKCLNCGAVLVGAFCASCGQRDIPAYPTTRELVVDAATELWGWDGRFAVTLRTLLRRPGKLTREFLEGRRSSYISPLRIYLLASVAYFVLAANAPEVKLASGRTLFVGLSVGGSPAGRAAGGSDPDPGRELTAAERAQLMAEIDSSSALIRPFLRKAVDDPEGLRQGVFQTLPRIFFALVPLFALLVSLFYRGRKFPEHLYFAVHLHAFAFLALAMTELVKYTRAPMPVLVVSAASLLAIPVYATFAFRRVYGGSFVRTIFKEIGIGVVYLVLAFAAFAATLFWVAR